MSYVIKTGNADFNKLVATLEYRAKNEMDGVTWTEYTTGRKLGGVEHNALFWLKTESGAVRVYGDLYRLNVAGVWYEFLINTRRGASFGFVSMFVYDAGFSPVG